MVLNGKFIFEKGEKCTFSIAGIKLREVPADELKDGKKVLEDDLQVARFLQSIDSDGDLINGIQITPEVLEVLSDALNGATTVPTDDNLTQVVSEVGQKVPDFKGKVVNTGRGCRAPSIYTDGADRRAFCRQDILCSGEKSGWKRELVWKSGVR